MNATIKAVIAGASLFVAASFASGQGTVGDKVGAPNAIKIGIDTAQQKLKEISINKFEDAGFWLSTISADDGMSSTRQFTGGPAGKADEPIPEERTIGVNPDVADKYVIGTRVDYFRRGYHEIFIYPTKPIPVEGITKTVSVWVVGRNYNHTLKLLVSDFFGNKFELDMGKLNFQGWKKLSVPVPPQSPDGKNGIIQRNYHYNTKMGIKIEGFKIETDPMESYGTYYVYFDDLRAVTDLFAEDSGDEDDMADSW
jgi:hypothetical protein